MPAKQPFVDAVGGNASESEAGGAQVGVTDTTADVGGPAAVVLKVVVETGENVILVDGSGNVVGERGACTETIEAGTAVSVGELGAHNAEVITDADITRKTTAQIQSEGAEVRVNQRGADRLVAGGLSPGTDGEVPAVG